MLDLWPKRKTCWGIATDIKICGSNEIPTLEGAISHHVWVALISTSFLEYVPCLSLIGTLPPEFQYFDFYYLASSCTLYPHSVPVPFTMKDEGHCSYLKLLLPKL